jgi:hypothetical protein
MSIAFALGFDELYPAFIFETQTFVALKFSKIPDGSRTHPVLVWLLLTW